MPLSYRPSSLALLNSPTKFQGGRKERRWGRGRQILGTPQQPSSTLKWLFVSGNALDKPQGSWRVLPLAGSSSPALNPHSARPGTPTPRWLVAALRLIPTESLRQPSTPTRTNGARSPKIPTTNLPFITQTPLMLLESFFSPPLPPFQPSWLSDQASWESRDLRVPHPQVPEGRILPRIPKMLALENVSRLQSPGPPPFCPGRPHCNGCRCPPQLAPPESGFPLYLPRSRAPRTWLAGGARDAVVGAAVLVVGAGVAVVGVSFGGVAAGGAVHAVVLVLVGVERFAVGSRGRRAVAVWGSPRGTVVVGIGGRRLGQSWRFLRRMVHGCGRLERSLEVAGSDAGDPSVKHSCHRSQATAVLAAVAAAAARLGCGAALV